MPPTDRFVISFAAEPPQEGLPYGRWADTLREHFLGACREIDTEGEEIATRLPAALAGGGNHSASAASPASSSASSSST